MLQILGGNCEALLDCWENAKLPRGGSEAEVMVTHCLVEVMGKHGLALETTET